MEWQMPKMKTKKSAAKRYSFTGTGKVKYKKQNLRHILTKKSAKRKRNLRQGGILSGDNVSVIKKQLLPYG
jgi:large subunit ribosomal protein L35